MDIRKLLGRNFARLREQSGLTQEQVAERAGISQQYVSGLERGQRNPTIEMLAKVAKALGVSHVDLLAETHGSNTGAGDASNGLSPAEE